MKNYKKEVLKAPEKHARAKMRKVVYRDLERSELAC